MSAPTRVQTTGWESIDDSGGAGTAYRTSITVGAAGRLLLLSCAHWTTANRLCSLPTDTRGNTWQNAGFVQGNNSTYHQLFICLSAAAGATTISATIQGGLSASSVYLCVTEVQGHNVVDWEEFASNAETSSTTTHTSSSGGSIALGTDPYVYVSGHLNGFTNTFTPGAGYSKVDDQDVVGDGSWFLFAQDQSATGAYSSDGPWTSDVSREATSVMVSFNPAGAAGNPWYYYAQQ